MLYLIDSNILIYAKMGAADEQKAVSHWLTSTLANKEHSIIVCETTLLAFLRISTNRKVFRPPLPLDQATEFIVSFLSHPAVGIIKPNAEHFSELGAFSAAYGFTGNLVMDAHLAVLARDAGAVLVTRDEDFLAVPFLKMIDPVKL